MISKVYSFKAAGQSRDDRSKTIASQVINPPISIKTPLEMGTRDDEFLKMHRNIEDTIADNLRNLISTNYGERLFDYYFGANLRELAFEMGSEEIDAEAVDRIQKAVSTYMPYVSLDTYEASRLEPTENYVAKTLVKITYNIPSINSVSRKIEVIIYAV